MSNDDGHARWRRDRAQWDRRLNRRGDEREIKPRAESRQIAGPDRGADRRDFQRISRGNPQTLAVERIVTGRAQQDGVDGKRSGDTKELADVVDVGDVLTDEDGAWVGA